MAKIWIEAYGCSASIADSEMMAGLLKNAGHEIVKDVNKADVNVIVTCAVKDATANRMVYRIKWLTRTRKPLVAAGCLAKTEPYTIQKYSPKASMLGPDAIDSTLEVVSTALMGRKLVALHRSSRPKVNMPRVRLNPIVSMVEIASGCLSDCSFCQTKLAKGKVKSYRIGDIVRQVRNDVREGCREVWLTSTDNGAYGRDLNCNLADLLRNICEIEGDFMVRVGMMNPAYVPFMADDLIEAYRNDKVFKFLHIPVQSGSDRLLRLMKRGHKTSVFADVAKRFRKEFTHFTIATDIIVGFPNEDGNDFQQTIDLMKEIEPDVINISKFSARPGTEASKMKRVNVKVVKERTKHLHEIVNAISYRRNLCWVGWHGEILIDEIKNNGVQGRNFAYKPVFLNETNITLGSKVNVKINSAFNHSLVGELELSARSTLLDP
ncbi:MAG: tRNA (N(6)-L-threonylcarbamoyladenosine(37)-C(2))-methylthiotransferase [Nitrososphaerales archaeon]